MYPPRRRFRVDRRMGNRKRTLPGWLCRRSHRHRSAPQRQHRNDRCRCWTTPICDRRRGGGCCCRWYCSLPRAYRRSGSVRRVGGRSWSKVLASIQNIVTDELAARPAVHGRGAGDFADARDGALSANRALSHSGQLPAVHSGAVQFDRHDGRGDQHGRHASESQTDFRYRHRGTARRARSSRRRFCTSA